MSLADAARLDLLLVSGGLGQQALMEDQEILSFIKNQADSGRYLLSVCTADKRHSLSTADRKAYVASYSRPGRMRAGWAYFAAWPDTASDFAQMAKTKLTMPVLSIAGEKASAAILGPQMKPMSTTVTAVDMKDTGDWLMEERPEETMKALIAFL